MFIVLALCLFLARDHIISRPEGAVLVTGLIAFLVITVLRTRAAGAVDHSGRDAEVAGIHPVTGDRSRAWATGIGYIILGIVGLQVGANFLISGATTIAEVMGIPLGTVKSRMSMALEKMQSLLRSGAARQPTAAISTTTSLSSV